jgi:sec-independent protein translocase protein TatB
MFDFGFWELILVMVVALLVVGPERLPGLARKAGLWVGKAKRFIDSVRSDIEREIRADELKSILNKQQSEIEELKGMLTDAHSQVKSEIHETESLVKAVEKKLESNTPLTPSSQQDSQMPSSTTSDNDAKQSKGS